jgi:putative aldouronate transport system substrate-binding protein
VEGVDYTLDGSDPVATKAAASDRPQGLSYCGSQQYVNVYVPGNEPLVNAEHAYLASVLPTGVSNPAWGLYSATASTKGATADKNLLNIEADVIQGRKSISAWDDAVKTWVKAAGDDERKEYEEAFAVAQNGES